jgi:hypothetical protein
MKYFIHSWLDVGAKFLCAQDGDGGPIMAHAELDVVSDTWFPISLDGTAYGPQPIYDLSDSSNWMRFNITELNTEIPEGEFHALLERIKTAAAPARA